MRWLVLFVVTLCACTTVPSKQSAGPGRVVATPVTTSLPRSDSKASPTPSPQATLAAGAPRIHPLFPAADQPLLLDAPEGCQFQSPSRAFDDSFARWLLNCPALFNPRIGSSAELISYDRQQGWTPCVVAGGSVWFVRDDVVLALAFSQPIVVEQRIRLTECPSIPSTRGAREPMR